MCVLKERVFRSHAEHLGENYVNGLEGDDDHCNEDFLFHFTTFNGTGKIQKKIVFH